MNSPAAVELGLRWPEDLNADDAGDGGTSRGHLFADISRSFARQDFATLRYNKQYVNGIGGIDPCFSTELTMAQLVTDVHSAVRAVADNPRIDPQRIYLFGWSEGIAAAAPDVPNLSGLILQGTFRTSRASRKPSPPKPQ